MEPRFTIRAVAHVPLYFWPWVWWQLFWLRAWTEATGREVLFEIRENGRVEVFMIADDERDLRSWMILQASARRPHLEALEEVPPGVSLIPVFMGKALERYGCLERWIWVRVVLRAAPPIADSS